MGDYFGVFGVGDVLRKLRKDKDWTLDELAEHSGVSRTTLWEVENGKLDARGSTLKRIAQAFGLDRLPEPSELAPSLPKVPPKPPTPIRTGVTYFDHPSSTNRENIPKGDDAHDPATARISELEALVEAQGREIIAMRNVLDALLADVAAISKAAEASPRRGKGHR